MLNCSLKTTFLSYSFSLFLLELAENQDFPNNEMTGRRMCTSPKPIPSALNTRRKSHVPKQHSCDDENKKGIANTLDATSGGKDVEKNLRTCKVPVTNVPQSVYILIMYKLLPREILFRPFVFS